MNWDDYLGRNCDKYRDLKQALSIEHQGLISEVSRWPRYQEAVRLKGIYLDREGYLANTSGLRHYLKNNLYPYPSMLSDDEVAELSQILNIFWIDASSYLPSYGDIFDISTGKPFTQSEIIRNYIIGLEENYQIEFTEDLMWEEEHELLKSIWENYLENNQKLRLKELDKSGQKQELLKLTESYAEYCKFLDVARSLKDRFISLWIAESIEKYKQIYLLPQVNEDGILDEIDLLTEIKERLPTLLNAEFNFDKHYFLLHKKYLRVVGINRGQARSGKRAWFKPTRWENCFPSKILPKLLNNESIVKQVVDMTRDSDPKDYWIVSENLIKLLEEFNLPPIKRFFI